MIIKTKKYKLPASTYIKIAFFGAIRRQWWILALIGFASFLLFYFNHAYWGIAMVILAFVFLGLRGFQFYAMTKMEQSKVLFSRLSYQISSKDIIMKVTSKQGMPIPWNRIKKVRQDKKRFVIFMGTAEFLCLPYRIFNTPQEIKFMKMLLRRKKLIKVKTK